MDLGVVLVILVALTFDFTNGFHDAANSIATVVSTRVLSPRYAVAWAAFFNFVVVYAVLSALVALETLTGCRAVTERRSGPSPPAPDRRRRRRDG